MIAFMRERQKKRRKTRQQIRFTPYAWAKLIFLRDVGQTEVGGFGISNKFDPLLIEDFVLIKQLCTSVFVEFDDSSVADFFEQQVDDGRRPDEFARVWIHTHPGNCPLPSSTDEATFERCFGTADWAVMFILSRSGATYARLGFNVGPTTSKRLGVAVDYVNEFAQADHCEWLSEYDNAVQLFDPFAGDRNVATADDREPGWPHRRAVEYRQPAGDWAVL